MKISKPTIAILTNFSTIGKGIVFRPGGVVVQVSKFKDCLAIARVPEQFPAKAPIYELSRLLSVISIFEDPDIEFYDSHLTVSSGRSKITYNYTDENLVIQPKRVIQYDEEQPVDVTFAFSEATRKVLVDAMSALRVKDIAFVGTNGKLVIRGYDSTIVQKKDNPLPLDVFEVEIGETEMDFFLRFEIELFNVMPGDYVGGLRYEGEGGANYIILEKPDQLKYQIACATE